MTRNDTMKLAFEAHEVATEITTKLHDPNHQFQNPSGPELVMQLAYLAEHCSAHGLRAVAKRLEQLAGDVASRSE